MLSGGSVAGKADAELFVVDTKPDAKVVCGGCMENAVVLTAGGFYGYEPGN